MRMRLLDAVVNPYLAVAGLAAAVVGLGTVYCTRNSHSRIYRVGQKK